MTRYRYHCYCNIIGIVLHPNCSSVMLSVITLIRLLYFEQKENRTHINACIWLVSNYVLRQILQYSIEVDTFLSFYILSITAKIVKHVSVRYCN